MLALDDLIAPAAQVAPAVTITTDDWADTVDDVATPPIGNVLGGGTISDAVVNKVLHDIAVECDLAAVALATGPAQGAAKDGWQHDGWRSVAHVRHEDLFTRTANRMLVTAASLTNSGAAFKALLDGGLPQSVVANIIVRSNTAPAAVRSSVAYLAALHCTGWLRDRALSLGLLTLDHRTRLVATWIAQWRDGSADKNRIRDGFNYMIAESLPATFYDTIASLGDARLVAALRNSHRLSAAAADHLARGRYPVPVLRAIIAAEVTPSASLRHLSTHPEAEIRRAATNELMARSRRVRPLVSAAAA